MQTFAQVLAMTGYSVLTWFVIQMFITGVKNAIAKPGFNRKAFIIGFAALTIGLCFWAFNTSAAMEACGKHHSAATCQHAIKR